MKAATYLDTHAVVWIYAGELDRFSRTALREVETADLRISPAVLLEIQLLQEIGRLSVGPETILKVLQRDVGLSVCVIPFHEVVTVAFQEGWTRDPFDRMIVAQAKAGQGKRISKDTRVQAAYARSLW